MQAQKQTCKQAETVLRSNDHWPLNQSLSWFTHRSVVCYNNRISQLPLSLTGSVIDHQVTSFTLTDLCSQQQQLCFELHNYVWVHLVRVRIWTCYLSQKLTQICATVNCAVDLVTLEVACPNPVGTWMHLWQDAMDIWCGVCSWNNGFWPWVIVERAWSPAVYLLRCRTLPWLASHQFVAIDGRKYTCYHLVHENRSY